MVAAIISATSQSLDVLCINYSRDDFYPQIHVTENLVQKPCMSQLTTRSSPGQEEAVICLALHQKHPSRTFCQLSVEPKKKKKINLLFFLSKWNPHMSYICALEHITGCWCLHSTCDILRTVCFDICTEYEDIRFIVSAKCNS